MERQLPDPSTRADEVGVVPLGVAGPGPAEFAWDLTVNGQPLTPGAYLVFLEIFDNGLPSGTPPGPQTVLLEVAADGSVQALQVPTATLLYVESQPGGSLAEVMALTMGVPAPATPTGP